MPTCQSCGNEKNDFSFPSWTRHICGSCFQRENYKHRKAEERKREKEERRRHWEPDPMAICSYCDKYDYYSIDHIVPSSKGGGSSNFNITKSCVSCNKEKAQRTLDEWLEEMDPGDKRYWRICMFNEKIKRLKREHAQMIRDKI